MTEREKYLNKLKGDLLKAANSKRFIESEDGSYVISLIKELITAKTNKILNARVERDEYIELRAQVDVLRRLAQTLEVQADETVINKLTEDIKLAETDV